MQFGQDSQGVGEGETVNVTVSLSANPERSVTIPITATGPGRRKLRRLLRAGQRDLQRWRDRKDHCLHGDGGHGTTTTMRA